MADPGRTYAKQRSTITGESHRGPPRSPGHNRSASYSGGAINPANSSVRRSQNYAAKAAAARLAQVMASHSTDNDDNDDDLHNDNFTSQTATSALSVSTVSRDTSPTPRFPRRPTVIMSDSRDKSPLAGIGAPYSGYGSLGVSSVRTNSSLGGLQPTRSVTSGWSNGSQRTRPTTLTSSLSKFTTTARRTEPSPELFREVSISSRDSRGSEGSNGSGGGGRRDEVALLDEIDVLQDENQQALNQLRLVEERLQETEIRNKELEKQIGSLGDGVSLEARLLSRKEAVLRQREAALRAEKEQTTDVKDDEIAALRLEADAARDEVLSATERSVAAEKEVHGLRSITRRMTLTKDEKEEMVLKRCWLARYWGLATRHGILPSVASSKHEHWSALAPLPLEVVTSAAQIHESNGHKGHKKAPSVKDLNEVISEGNVEGMLAVEKGLRELASLKVEQSVMLSSAQHVNPSLGRSELSPEEVEDIRFKQAWLVYFWRRAKSFKVEADIADERLSYWTSRSNHAPTSHDVVDVERGLLELHKLGVEEQLWETSRREVSRAAANQNAEVDEAG
ncbi:unnamed protein product [Calypogeia fissa]